MEPPSRAGVWWLQIGGEGGDGFRRLASGDELLIGSAAFADLRLRDRAVSARHARLSVSDAGVRVQDLGSKNGIFVGPARVGGALLSTGNSSFVLGRTTLTLEMVRGTEEPPHESPLAGLVGNSSALRRLSAKIRRCAPLSAPVLILGESGSGKDVVARALHEVSGRAGTYLPVNVGAIAESLADAELFGHRRGSFTGAVSDRVGAFEAADGGTLFLDEVADLSPGVQVKLLRVLEDGCVRAVGGTRATRVGVRVISATWQSLDGLVEAGRFREDLLHRISTLTLEIPPLRERRGDIPILAEFLLEKMQGEVGSRRLSSAALARLAGFEWPGNVRQLRSVLYRAAVASSEPEINARAVAISMPVRIPSRSRPIRLSAAEAFRLLRECEGNVSAAARTAQVPRSTFRSWLG